MAQRALTPGKAAYCSECGAETLPDAASCARCGEPFEGSIQAVLCPICNSINPASAVECMNCNAKFPEPGFSDAPAPASPESPEEEYLRRILQLSREKARRRGAAGPTSGAEPASLFEADRAEGELEESLWKLAEPFDRMLERRKQRLEQMEALIERAQARIKTLEGSEDPEHVREREDLKRQIETLLQEKEDILKLEEGLVDMETTYRNILRMQKDELKARESSLRGRISAFRHELESREKAFGQLKERESDVVRREDEFRTVMNRVHEREQQKELLNLKGELKVVMKDIDELLGDLPKDKIRKFAKSEKFALYEKLLEQLQLL